MLAGIPAELRALIERAPEEQRVLLELRLRWPALDDARARIAARLRVFLLTWDPLDWHDRPPARATAIGEGDDYELLLYLPLEQALATAATAGEEIAVVLGDFAASVLAVGAAHERTLAAGSYPRLAFAGEAPGLLSQVGTLSDLPPPAISLASSAWEPIGPAAIQDLVQEAFGPVDLDRAPVLLAPAAEPVADCPACAGQRLGFPDELGDAQATMCAPHAAAARAIADERIQRGWDSNRAGMDALLGTSSMLTQPTYGLSLTLLRDLDDASHRVVSERPSRAELASDAELALALAARLTGEPELLQELRESERLAPDWMVELPMALASGGLVDEAVAVGDAFAALDPEDAELFADDVALILAEAGRAAEALERVRRSAERGSRDVWTHVRAAAVHAELQDPQRAEASLRSALVLARSRDDAEDVATVWDRLAGLLAEQPGREHESDAARQEADRWFDAAFGGTRLVAKVGRNDPCPCGSGRKHKRCCGG